MRDSAAGAARSRQRNKRDRNSSVQSCDPRGASAAVQCAAVAALCCCTPSSVLTLDPATALVLRWALNLHVKGPEARYGSREEPRSRRSNPRYQASAVAVLMDTYGHLFPDAEDLGRGAIDAIFAVALTEQERNQETW